MREILSTVRQWQAEGKKVAIATVIEVWGSAPRPPGAKMAYSSAGDMAGSVSGGCVEGAVIEAAREVLASGVPRLLSFGVADEEAWAVGLSCGGAIEVFVEPATTPVGRSLVAAIEHETLVAAATVIAGPRLGAKSLVFKDGTHLGEWPSAVVEAAVLERLPALFQRFGTARVAAQDATGVSDVFLEVHPPRPQLILVGAVHAAVPLVDFAKALGYHTLIVDPRGVFASAERFAHADELHREWPQEVLPRLRLDEATCLATLSHDPKIDLPALEIALAKPLAYVGALGSKKTHAKRTQALVEKGFTAEQIARIHAPIGLDLGGRKPEEIALSILAEIVAVSHGRDRGR